MSEKSPAEAADLWHLWHFYVFSTLKKIRTVWQKPRNVTKFKTVTLWHLDMSQNVTKCHTFSNSKFLLHSYVYLSCLDLARNDSNSQSQSPMIAWREGGHQYQALDRFILREVLACRRRRARCRRQDYFVNKRRKQDFLWKNCAAGNFFLKKWFFLKKKKHLLEWIICKFL